MKLALLIAVLALGTGCAISGEEPDKTPPVKKLPPDERKRRFEALKKELEAFKPAADAEREEVLGYLQQVLNSSAKFAKENPRTAEGFEAACSGALQLASRSHPKSAELAQVALDIVPEGGVDMRQIAICWLLVGNGKAVNGDFAGAHAAIDKMKPLAPDLHTAAVKQLDEVEAKAKAAKKDK
jgi:hypothetical protein